MLIVIESFRINIQEHLLLLKKETFQEKTRRAKKYVSDHNSGINPNKSAPRGHAVMIILDHRSPPFEIDTENRLLRKPR